MFTVEETSLLIQTVICWKQNLWFLKSNVISKVEFEIMCSKTNLWNMEEKKKQKETYKDQQSSGTQPPSLIRSISSVQHWSNISSLDCESPLCSRTSGLVQLVDHLSPPPSLLLFFPSNSPCPEASPADLINGFPFRTFLPGKRTVLGVQINTDLWAFGSHCYVCHGSPFYHLTDEN